MTIDEAAKALGLTPGTLRSQIHKGNLRSTKRGRDHWLRPSDLEAYRRDHQGRIGRPEGAKDRGPRKKPTTPA